MVNAHLRATARGRGSAGRASPCQGEGRGFESRRPLGRRPGNRPDFLGGVAERRGNGLQIRVRGFKSRRHLETLLGPLAQWLARFLDTEEVTGSIPVWSTKTPISREIRPQTRSSASSPAVDAIDEQMQSVNGTLSAALA